MRPSFAPAPGRDRLGETSLHVLVRDYPELLALFRRRGIDLEAKGAVTLVAATPSPAALLDRVEAALAWRRGGG